MRFNRTCGRAGSVAVARAMATLCPLHELRPDDLDLGLLLFERSPRLTGRDALHVATAINRGVPVIISPDPDFDGLDQLRRIDPIEAVSLIG